MTKKIIIISFFCCAILPVTLRGEVVSNPFFECVDITVHPARMPLEEVRSIIAAYPSAIELQKDIVLGLRNESVAVRDRVLSFLSRVHTLHTHVYRGEMITEYEKIRMSIDSPLIRAELRRINNKNTPINCDGFFCFRAKLDVMYLIRIYELHQLFDIIYANANHEEVRIRISAYDAIGDVGKFNRRKAMISLRRGLKDGGAYVSPFTTTGGFRGTSRVRETAADACLKLGGRFRLMLWCHAPDLRYKFFE